MYIKEIDMANITFSKKGSKTTNSIDHAPFMTRWLWERASKGLNANIVRVRAELNRYGYEQGDTFDSFHYGKVSVYRQRQNPKRALYFARRIPLTKVNKGMQIFEHADNMDTQDTFDALHHIKYVTETGYFTRLFNRIVFGTPMTLNS